MVSRIESIGYVPELRSTAAVVSAKYLSPDDGNNKSSIKVNKIKKNRLRLDNSIGINPSSEVSFAALPSTTRGAGRHPSSGLSADGAGEIAIFLQVTI